MTEKVSEILLKINVLIGGSSKWYVQQDTKTAICEIDRADTDQSTKGL